MLRGESIEELRVVDISKDGWGIAYLDNKVVKVKYGVPGDVVKAKVWAVRKGRRRVEYWADILEVLSKGDDRIEAKCPYFGRCGGCRFQNMRYDAQLRFKKRLIENAFKEYDIDVSIDDVIPSPKIYYYRNRMDYPVGVDDEGNVVAGLKMIGRWDVIIDLNECHLMSIESIEILKRVKEFIIKHNIQAYNVKTHEGFLRYVVVREGKYTGDRLVIFITKKGAFVDIEELAKEISDLVTGVVWGINDRLADLSVAEEVMPIYGRDYINEVVNGFKYHIHPNAFFQTNSYQTGNLVNLVYGFASGGKLLLDVYSGVGLFSIALHDKYESIIGIEIDPYAVYSARINVNRLGSSSIAFLESSAEDALSRFHEKPDTVILDPPRPGISKIVRRNILRLEPSEIIYVSCNPESMARDIKLLLNKYIIEDVIKPIDMFPHTPHIEAVARLVKK